LPGATNLRTSDIMLCGYLVLFPLAVKITEFIKINEKSSLILSQLGLIIIIAITLLLIRKRHDPEFANYIRMEKLFLKVNGIK